MARATTQAATLVEVRTNGTFAVRYPDGYVLADIAAAGAHQLHALQSTYTAPTDFTVALGASSATITWLRAQTLPRNTAVLFGFVLRDDDDDFDDLVVEGTLTVGEGLQFPATQNTSADPNTLDDYEEGTATVTLTCVTPGDLSVVYTVQTLRYTKIGNRVYFTIRLVCVPTWATASGNAQIAGLPFTSVAGSSISENAVAFSGITSAGIANVVGQIAGGAVIVTLAFSASGAGISVVPITLIPSAGSLDLRINGSYEV